MKKASVIFFLFLSASIVQGQQTRFANNPDEKFEQARDYFQKGQYSLAYPLLKELQLTLRETDRSNQALNYQEVRYYTTVCALKQDEDGAAPVARDYIETEDNAPRVEMMNFHLAEYYFRKQNYALAIPAYQNTNIANLNAREIADLKFHHGYAHFSQKEYAQAKPLLQSIARSPQDINYKDANYYYGYITFNEKNYEEALRSFSVVEDHEYYGKIVPYYIATINYSNNQKDKALSYLEDRLKRGGQVYDNEMRQLVGHAYFERQQYTQAVPYLESYVSNSEKVKREDLYELAYSYYKTGNLNKAIDGFKQLSGKEDSLSQNAMYLLGDAYLKTGQKANARNAFLFCSANSSNEQQREISMFNYAKLSYELGYQDIALSELQKFISTYPQSEYSTEAKDLLIGVFANTNNYREALQLLEAIPNPSPATRRLIPRVLYGRATELANDGMLVTANELLTRAENAPDNQAVLPYVQFWKGEIAYRLDRIEEASRYFFEYLKSSAVNGEVNPRNAQYNLGYCFLKRENYSQALGYFTQVAGSPSANASAVQQDAYLRAADCYFMNRDYNRASAMYSRVLEFSWPAADYATYQRGLIAGVSNGQQKINELSSISKRFPNSSLVDDANFEIAGAYLASEQFREAIPYLNAILSSQNEAMKPRAHLRLGLAYYNLQNNTEALNQYTTLLKQFPNSPEANEGLENARAIFVEEGRSDEYVAFARSMGREVSATQEDQLAYAEAEVQLNNGNFAAAAAKFEDYLKRFPNGAHNLEALYYKSEIYLSQKDWAKAAQGYELLADRVPHRFAEKSLTQAARLNFFDLKNYEKAETYFRKMRDFAPTQNLKLEAMRGLLRSQYQLEKWDDAVANARELLDQKSVGTDDRILANLAIAKSHQLKNDCAAAITHYRTVASLSKAAYGAEARYEIANCQFAQNQLADAEKSAFEVINKSGSYSWWVTKSYILLGDIYFKQKDYFNAKATFQSVVDNAREEDLKTVAASKLQQVVEEEKRNSKIGD